MVLVNVELIKKDKKARWMGNKEIDKR